MSMGISILKEIGSDTMNNRTQSALIGGAMLGILSAIPFVNILNACCCLWAIAGGALAAYLYIKRSASNGLSVSIGDGAMLGAIAGLIGAGIYLAIGVPINYAMGSAFQSVALDFLARQDPAQAAALQEQFAQQQSLAGAFLSGLLVSVMLIIFSVLGGIIGTAIFGKRSGGMNNQTPPPPYDNQGGMNTPPNAPPTNYGAPGQPGI